MDTIIIRELEVFCRVGVTAEERAQPQRLQVTVEMTTDFGAAAASDSLADTIDYAAVSERILGVTGVGTWELIERLAVELADLILAEFRPREVGVEIRKFIIPQARHVAVRLRRGRRE